MYDPLPAVTNKEVAQAWAQNRRARNHNGTFRTDGQEIFSYDLCIGFTDSEGVKTVFVARAPLNFVSANTTKHVGYALRLAAHAVSSRPDFEARRASHQETIRHE